MTMSRTVLIVAAVLTLSAAAGATTLLPADFSLMVGASQVIVHARVVDVRGQLDRRRRIESLVTIEVVDTLKGSHQREMVFHVPGGKLGRYRRVLIGAPVFAPGDEVVLFLRGSAATVPAPFALSQGVYRVSRRSGAPTVMPLPASMSTVRGDPARRPISLDAFTQQVRTLVGVAR
jgi:hypothetical protein